ncbi:MAG: MBL fold metallo-hydrolase [Natronomonas sp.]
MAIGDTFEATVGSCEDIYYVDTGMYDVEAYGSVYIIDAERPALVDTGIGTNYERILGGLETVGIDPADLAVIAPTHAHLDHAGGAGFLIEECPNATVCLPRNAAKILTDPARLWEGTKQAVGNQLQFYTEPKPLPEDRIERLDDGDEIDLGDTRLEVIEAPGHAFHQSVYYQPDTDAVYAADAAGVYIPSRDEVRQTSPPPGFDLEAVLEDVRRLQDLDPETICYGHFGPALAEDRLETFAEIITEWVEAVEDKRAELEDDDAVIEHFAAENDVEGVWGELKAREETAMNVRGVLHYLDEG